jgi:GMP synthase (glutamine-hydrolysing)
VFQWHAYTFDLPASAVHLAATDTCRNQAFRYGRHAYGLQFHLEADEAQIGRWLHIPAYRAELDAGQMEKILGDTRTHIADALRLGERVFGEFLELFAWRPKLLLASR